MEQKYGILLNKDAKIYRQYFREAVKLIGIYVLYRAPKPNKHYTTYLEIEANYEEPILVGCLFNDHPDQKTLKKVGWVAELQPNASLIQVDYDLPGLQQGALFYVPSGLDDGKARLFRVVTISNSMVYPSSVICEIIPEYEDTLEEGYIYDYSETDFNLIDEEEDDRMFV